MINTKKLFKYLNKVAIAILLLSTVIAANASPVTMEVTPIDNSVMPGQTATYQVDLANPSGSDEALIDIYIEDSTLAGVTYGFSSTTGTISAGTTKTITLSAYVPDGKPVGSYTFDVKARVGSDIFGTGEIIEDPDPYEYLNVILDVEIPEFPTLALPVISVLGLMFIMKRRNEKK